jgi:hypothetical protein
VRSGFDRPAHPLAVGVALPSPLGWTLAAAVEADSEHMVVRAAQSFHALTGRGIEAHGRVLQVGVARLLEQ